MSRRKEKAAAPTSETPELRIKINLGDNMLGPGKIQLLARIGTLGSISAAAREMGLGYRRAQFLIETLQACFAAPLLVTSRGGGGKGGAKLTAAGQELVARHQEFIAGMQAQAAPFMAWLAAQQDHAGPS